VLKLQSVLDDILDSVEDTDTAKPMTSPVLRQHDVTSLVSASDKSYDDGRVESSFAVPLSSVQFPQLLV